ncbi:MAG: IPT/TIG domain-containing protein [Treponema sp.]|jgi:transglutaminase-like putative cysteine protease|nr:IPT/TIG domain-containing protein [Treponema sp.]
MNLLNKESPGQSGGVSDPTRKTLHAMGGLKLRVFLIGLSMGVVFSACEEETPLIVSIDPRVGTMGEVLTIRGHNFGNERDESYITIAGTPPTFSSYIQWTDESISLTIPEFGASGLVYVHRGDKKSNPAIFSNQATMPEPVSAADVGSGPRISSVEPGSGSIGSLVTIMGNGFGSSREGSGVFFSWDTAALTLMPVEATKSEQVEVFETEFGYELWSEREIRVRVPDGAASGDLEVRTSGGTSRPAMFTVTGKPGTKTFKDKRTYTISYTVNIQVQVATLPNTLYLWVPHPVTSGAQRNIELMSRNREPFVEHYRGATLFQFHDLGAKSGVGINLSYRVDVYTIETTLRSASIRQISGSPIPAVYSLPSVLIPSDNPLVVTQTNAIIGRESNPYEKARKLYEWLIQEGGIQVRPLNNGVVEALEEKRGDPYSAALLFCAMARAARVPAIPVAGVLIDRSRSTSRHYWAEFWIDGFGWIPVDPALGAGAAPADFNLRGGTGADHEAAAYYFGNLDNQRIAFSRGQGIFSQMDPRGRLAVRNREYALQNLWEEAVGGLESYSSLWSDMTITGMYVQ